MSVYIKGMETPTNCFDCPFMYGRRYCRANSKIEFNDPEYSELKGRYDGCPLVPVPDHGRLISADLLKADFTGNFTAAYPTGLVWAMIDDAPTIIPSSKEEHT